MCIYLYMFIYMYVYIYVYMYVFIIFSYRMDPYLCSKRTISGLKTYCLRKEDT